MHQDFIYDWRCDHRIFQCMLINYIIPVFLMFASTFKVLTGLSLAIVLARLLARTGALRWHSRNLSNGDSSLAKIGVNLVSCSCGKWSRIDTDDSQTASVIEHQKPFDVLIGHNGLVLHILYFCLEFLYQVGASSANSNPGAGEHDGHFLEINVWKIRSWQTWYQSQADHWLILS